MGNEEAPIKLKIVPHDQDAIERTYSNYVSINHTPYDFTLDFCEVLPPTAETRKEAERSKRIPAKTKVRIALPPIVIPGLIKALTDQKTKYDQLMKQDPIS